MYICKKIPVFLLLMCSAVQSWAAKPFFYNVAGAVLEYERTDAATHRHVYTHFMTIESVENLGGGVEHVVYNTRIVLPDNSLKYGGVLNLTADITPEGDVRMNVGQTLLAVVRNYFPRMRAEVSGGDSVLPASMSPGDVLQDARAAGRVSSFNVAVDVTERTVLRKETITTPAGDFECMVVRERKVEKWPMGSRKTMSLTWYAPGYGMIRHDTYNMKNVLETSEVLVNIK